MGLTSGGTLIVLILLAVAAPVAAALAWNHTGRRPWLHWPARVGLLVACQVTACLAVAAAVNDAGQFYTSWDQLFGTDVGVSQQAGARGPNDPALVRQLAAGYRTHHSIVVSVPVPDAGGTRAHEALVYLPAAYFDPGYADRRFPVVELFDGFPGSPQSWTVALKMQNTADTEISAGRATPFVAVMPEQNYVPHHDAECIDAVHGPQVETTLTRNVRAVIDRDFRVGVGRWGAMGYSTGGFCAVNIAVRHPNWYSAAVSLSGYNHPYQDATTGRLFGNNLKVEYLNDPLWRLQHMPAPQVSLLLASTADDPWPAREAVQLAKVARKPTQVYLLPLSRGGHTYAAWRAMEPASFDWLSARLGGPSLAPMVLTAGLLPQPYPPPGATHPVHRKPVTKPPVVRAGGQQPPRLVR